MLLNLAKYAVVAFALYYLYAPQNDHPNNKPGSSSQFVYQQF